MMDKKEQEEWIERKCASEGCYNYHMSEYIYCEPHMYGFPRKLPDEIPDEIIKKLGRDNFGL